MLKILFNRLQSYLCIQIQHLCLKKHACYIVYKVCTACILHSSQGGHCMHAAQFTKCSRYECCTVNKVYTVCMLHSSQSVHSMHAAQFTRYTRNACCTLHKVHNLGMRCTIYTSITQFYYAQTICKLFTAIDYTDIHNLTLQ